MIKDGKEEDASAPPTHSGDRLFVLLFITLVEVVEVADVSGFDAHQAGQTLHVFITEGRQKASCHCDKQK